MQALVRVYDLASGREVLSMAGHSSWVNCLVYSPDGKRLVTGSADENVKLWDTTTGQEVFTLTGHSRQVIGVAFSPDGRRLASCSYGSGRYDEVRVWDATPPDEGPRK